MTITEVDNIIALARNNAVNSKNLIVVSHYPLMSFPMAKYPSEDVNWVKDHVWKDGYAIQHRLSELRPYGQTIFLCGDGHIPDAFVTGNKSFVMTGLFGGDYTKKAFNEKDGLKSYNINTQARIIDFGENKTKISTFNYKPIAFEYDVQIGDWEYESSFIREVVDKPKPVQEQEQSKTIVLSQPLEVEIIDRIRNEKLYKLGRFNTSKEFNSLSWISINRLLEEQQILVSIIDKGIDWFKKIITDSDKALIVGVDFFGSMIGTNLAIRLQYKNHCITSRFTDNHTQEFSIAKLVSEIEGVSSIKDIIFITDVVSSGQSLLSLINLIEDGFESIKKMKLDVKYHNFSIISDVNIQREDFDQKMNTIRTACGSLRMPVLRADSLPNTEILSSRIDFNN